ncbi:MAG: hypothetical protein IIA60_01735 [Candidatus Marinimicrobia bacterium]|nr:hypothetical protein [Candidatus Neomarinimicrobiota bacterium]
MAEEKINVVMEGLRDVESISAICRHEGIGPKLYYPWGSPPADEFLEAGEKRLKGDTMRVAKSSEVSGLRNENE